MWEETKARDSWDRDGVGAVKVGVIVLVASGDNQSFAVTGEGEAYMCMRLMGESSTPYAHLCAGDLSSPILCLRLQRATLSASPTTRVSKATGTVQERLQPNTPPKPKLRLTLLSPC